MKGYVKHPWMINSALRGEIKIFVEDRDHKFHPATKRTLVAVASLMELDLFELAGKTRQSRRGDPAMNVEDRWRDPEQALIVAKAFRLGHLADPEGCHVICPLEVEVTDEHLIRGFMSKCDGCLIGDRSCP